MRIIGTIRSTETTTIEVDADDYETGKAELERQVPEGQQLISIRVMR